MRSRIFGSLSQEALASSAEGRAWAKVVRRGIKEPVAQHASCQSGFEKIAAACHAAPLARGARIGILIAIRTSTFAEKIGLKPFFISAQLRLEIIGSFQIEGIANRLSPTKKHLNSAAF